MESDDEKIYDDSGEESLKKSVVQPEVAVENDADLFDVLTEIGVSVDKVIYSNYSPFLIRSFESEETYEKLGVRVFKKIIPTGGDYMRRYSGWYKWSHLKSNKISLQIAACATILYESIHIVGFGYFMELMITQLELGHLKGFGITSLTNVIINVYPIMLQRYNRMRLLKVIKQLDDRKNRVD